MLLKTRSQSQRDPRWGSILLGFNTSLPYSIYNYGCLITSLANYIDKQPDEVNQILKDNNGFVNGGNFVWAKCTALGLNEQYVSARCQAVPLYSTEVTKLRDYIKQGQPALCEVDFNPATDGEEMHFVLAVGFTDTEIIVIDPWEGQQETWSDAAFQRNTYQYRVYDKKLPTTTTDVMVQVESKVFENLVRKASIYDKVYQKLNVSDSESVVLGELDKLISYQDTLVQRERQLQSASEKITDLDKQLQELQAQQDLIKIENAKLQEQMTTQSNTITTQGQQITALSDALQKLKAAAVTKVYAGWKAALIKLVTSLPF